MADEKIEVSSNGLWRLQSAARDCARAEIDRLLHAVIAEMRSRVPTGIFEDIYARHLWDEYCWSRQEGPFNDPTIIGDTNFGSISNEFASLLHGFVSAEVQNLPDHKQVFVSALAAEEDEDIDEGNFLGCVWVDGIVQIVIEAVHQRASQRKLDLLGPDRSDAIGYELQGTGFVWSVLDRSVAMSLVQSHVDTMIDPDADLSPLADEMIGLYLTTAREDEDGGVSIQLLKRFEKEIRSMIMEKDLLPSLGGMRRKLLEALDG